MSEQVGCHAPEVRRHDREGIGVFANPLLPPVRKPYRLARPFRRSLIFAPNDQAGTERRRAKHRSLAAGMINQHFMLDDIARLHSIVNRVPVQA